MIRLLSLMIVFTVLAYRPPVNPLIAGKTGEVKIDTSLNGEWFLQPVLASDIATGKIPSIRFNVSKKTFTGNTGCNAMSGSFQLTDTSLIFSEQIMTTKMSCIGYNEAAFLKNLLRSNRYKVENGTLVLLFDATEISRWTRQEGKRKKTDTV